MDDGDKAKSKSVSLHPDQWAVVDQIVEASPFNGERSKYFQMLVEADKAQDSKGRWYSKVGAKIGITAEDHVMQRIARLEQTMNEIAEALHATTKSRHPFPKRG